MRLPEEYQRVYEGELSDDQEIGDPGDFDDDVNIEVLREVIRMMDQWLVGNANQVEESINNMENEETREEYRSTFCRIIEENIIRQDNPGYGG